MNSNKTRWPVIILPWLIFVQMMLAALSLFGIADLWPFHIGFGFLLMVPIVWLIRLPKQHVNPWPARLILILYLIQITLGAAIETYAGWLISAHFINALLMFMTSLRLVNTVQKH